jgi:hypothetical protein
LTLMVAKVTAPTNRVVKTAVTRLRDGILLPLCNVFLL